MENIKFYDVLRNYEDKVENIKYFKQKKNIKETSIIKNDIKRSIFLSINKRDVLKQCVLKKIVFDCLISINVSYIQGINEIAFVIIHYYFSKDYDLYFNKEKIQNHNLTFEDEELIDNNYNSANFDFDNIVNDKTKGFFDSISKKQEKVKIVLTNIILRKLEPLIKNNFELYMKYTEVFIIMMKKRGIIIGQQDIHKYLESILTFFYRNVSSMEDAYKIFEVILSCPSSSLFLILIVYYDLISRKELIKNVDNNLFNSIICHESEFINTLEKVNCKKSRFFSKYAFYIGGMIGVIAAVALYKINKRDEN